MPFTYRELIHTYSNNVEKGYSDIDLTPRQRRLVTIMLNLASNESNTVTAYPPSEDVRNRAVKHLDDILWDARWLALAMVGNGRAAADDDISIAQTRTIEILRNM